MSKSSELLDEARAINSSLSRVQQSLSWSVAQTSSAAALLGQDSASIQAAVHEHKHELKSALQSTNRRLNRLQLSERYEALAMRLAVGFFTAVAIFVALSRTQLFALLLRLCFCASAAAPQQEDDNDGGVKHGSEL